MNTDTRLVPLTQGKFATVDACDYDWAMQFKWCAHKQPTSYGYNWYAKRGAPRPSKKLISMHREIAQRAGLPESPRIDHHDRNGLNNARQNLRPCIHRQNLWNGTKRIGTTSKFKGVSWANREKKWKAAITLLEKQKFLGYFHEEIDAALAYDAAARMYFGEFACVNFPELTPVAPVIL